ncbi:MAG: GIY-YIG nuclease family protein [Thermomicrobiales bacterium]|nr:GIY-YIG nuclease family protein [Thermomicrobiales bacterium]
MSTNDRRAAKAAYKERKPAAGVYAVRCAPTGEVWVGATPNLDAIQNRIWFTLRHGGDAFRSLQMACQEHGEGSIAFEALERLDEEVSPLRRNDLLKQRAAHWRATLQAQEM